MNNGNLQSQSFINSQNDTIKTFYGNGQIAFQFGFLSCNLGYFQSSFSSENEFVVQNMLTLRERNTADQKLWNAGLALSPLPGLSLGVNYNTHHQESETLNRDDTAGNSEWISINKTKADYETYDAGISLHSDGFYLGTWVSNLGDNYTTYSTGEGGEDPELVPLYDRRHIFISFPLFTRHLVVGNHLSWQTSTDSILVADEYMPTESLMGSWTVTLNAAFSSRVNLSGLYQYGLNKQSYKNIDPVDVYPEFVLYENLEPFKDIQHTYGINLSVPVGKYQLSASILKQDRKSLDRKVNRASPDIFNLVQNYYEDKNLIYGLSLAANF